MYENVNKLIITTGIKEVFLFKDGKSYLNNLN